MLLLVPTALLNAVKLKVRWFDMGYGTEVKDPQKLVDDIATKENKADKAAVKKVLMAPINAIKPKETKPDTGETTNPMGDKYAKGGKVRGCGCAVRGKTKGRMV